jgi:hypothetical protein
MKEGSGNGTPLSDGDSAKGIHRGGSFIVDFIETVKVGLFTVDLQRYAKKGSGIGNLLP